jgi:hypothetical protein
VWLSEKRAAELTQILKNYPGIEWVQLPWAGVDGFQEIFAAVDHDTAPVFTSAKGSYAEPVAEHALALALALQRELPSKSRDAVWQKERTGLSLYGNHVIINHGNGYTTLYGHLSRFAVRGGQKIKRGQLIGYVGNTGRSTGSHLHYEVRKHKNPLNPAFFYRNDLSDEQYQKMIELSQREATRFD